MTLQYLLGIFLVLMAVGYWLFFKKFFSELGKQTAELSTLAKRTTIVEDIKASLSRKNIAFQIHNAEFARLRFERLDQLYGKLYDLQKFSKAHLFAYADKAGFEENKKGFMDRYWQTEDAYYLSLLYLDDETAHATLDLLNECFISYSAFVDFYYSDPNRAVFRNLQLSESMIQKNIKSFDRFDDSIKKFPQLLQQIRTEVHKTLKDDNGA